MIYISCFNYALTLLVFVIVELFYRLMRQWEAGWDFIACRRRSPPTPVYTHDKLKLKHESYKFMACTWRFKFNWNLLDIEFFVGEEGKIWSCLLWDIFFGEWSEVISCIIGKLKILDTWVKFQLHNIQHSILQIRLRLDPTAEYSQYRIFEEIRETLLIQMGENWKSENISGELKMRWNSDYNFHNFLWTSSI